jgi:pimeloyl-ACP methyl ester carboxylesterase
MGWLRLMAGGRGRPLVMVHGLGGSAEDFRQLCALLGDSFTCLVLDLPGFGFSAKPDLPYTQPFFVQVLVELADELGLARPSWLGHSMGGQIVLGLAATRPKLAHRVVAVCPSGGHLRPSPIQRLLEALLSRGDCLRFFHPGLVPLAVAYVCGDPLRGPLTPAIAELAERIKTQWSGPERPLLERSLIRSARGLLAHPVWPLLPQVRAPLLLLAARGDRVIPQAQTERLRLYAPADTVFQRIGGGHMPPYLAAWELAQAVRRFLG